MTTTIVHEHRPRRSTATRLSPYAVEEFTLTLEEWHRARDAGPDVVTLTPSPRAA